MIKFCIISADQNTIDSFLLSIKQTIFTINEKEQVEIVPSFEEYKNEKNGIDVLILDLETNPINDIKEIDLYKESSINKNIKIILVSNTNKFAVSAFEYGVVGYVVKPIDESIASTFIQKAVIEIIRYTNIYKLDKNNSIVLKDGDTYEKISLFDIAYIEVTKHDVFYHVYKSGAPDKIIKNRGSLKKIREQLPSTIFASPGINCLVNLKYITKISNDNLYLGEDQIHISRAYRKDILAAFKEYYKR